MLLPPTLLPALLAAAASLPLSLALPAPPASGAADYVSGIHSSSSSSSSSDGHVSPISPSPAAARNNSAAIFNAVADAMRQWGSSLHHNGMSFFLTTVPAGVLLHHGSRRRESPTEPEWLAFEIEHAESFARAGVFRPRRPPPPSPARGERLGGDDELESAAQRRLGGEWRESGFEAGQERRGIREGGKGDGADDDDDDDGKGGWLHVYRTARAMQYLYIDGMGAAKCGLGTLDSQDLILRGNRSVAGGWRVQKAAPKEAHRLEEKKQQQTHVADLNFTTERDRAKELCRLATEWGLAGVIRMETGFEIIHCDFSDGLDEVQLLRRPRSRYSDNNGPPGSQRTETEELEKFRGVAERYDGIGSARARIDFSSMVSAYFYPVNLTNPDAARPDLARVVSTSDDELRTIRTDVGRAVARARKAAAAPARVIDWQDIADMIVTRYADRLRYMVEEANSTSALAQEVGFLLTVFVNYAGDRPGDGPAAIDRCADLYLGPITPATQADELIRLAFRLVTAEICSALFRVRGLVTAGVGVESVSQEQEEEDDAKEARSVGAAKEVLRTLMGFLNWARFKRCIGCSLGEVCVIPMWPFGTVEQYWAPACTSNMSWDGHFNEGESYWRVRLEVEE